MLRKEVSVILIVAIILIIVILIIMGIYFKFYYANNTTNNTNNQHSKEVTVEFIDGVNNSKTMQELKSLTQKDLISAIENITDDQLIEICFGANCVLSKGLYKLDTFGVDFIEGEYWENISRSVSSKEEALKIAYTSTSEKGSNVSIEFIGENDLYYEVRSTYSRFFKNTTTNMFGITKSEIEESKYPRRFIFFKDNVIKIEGKAYNSGYSEPSYSYYFSNGVFQKRDYNTVLSTLDIVYGDCLYRYMEENEKEYVYTRYYIEVVGGDYGVDSTVSLKREQIKVDKNSGKISLEREITIKENISFSNFIIK